MVEVWEIRLGDRAGLVPWGYRACRRALVSTEMAWARAMRSAQTVAASRRRFEKGVEVGDEEAARIRLSGEACEGAASDASAVG